MKNEYRAPWKVVESVLRSEFPVRIIEIHSIDGDTPFPWTSFDADGRSYAKRLRLAKRVVKAVNAARFERKQ